MDGNLLQQLVSLSGLPESEALPWLQQAFMQRQIDPAQATLEQVRDVLADVLQDFILNREN